MSIYRPVNNFNIRENQTEDPISVNFFSSFFNIP